ncbi:hypothetical protein L7F22_061606 [Adiantum nelumboides]|nr:hypothetical protein [Adiantum nelumboides]
MADNNKENKTSIDDFDFAHEEANDDTPMLVTYFVTRLQQAMGNPALQGKVQQQLHAYEILPCFQQERGPERSHGETSKRGLSTENGVENPYQDLKQLLEGKPSLTHVQHEGAPSKEREESESQDESMEDVAPRRRRAQRSPTPTKRKRSPHSPHPRESKREEKNSKKKERKRSPSSPSSSPSSSSDESSGYSSQEKQRRGHQMSYATWKRSNKLKKFKEGRKNISSSPMMVLLVPRTRLWANGEAPKTLKALRASIMKQFLASDAKDKVLTKWRSLKLSPYESIHKYVDMFWDLHLKATVYKKIYFEDQKQQFCARLSEDMNEYVNFQRPKSFSAVIHYTMVGARINFHQGAKRNLKPMEAKDKQEYKGNNPSQSSSKGNSNNNKAKEKGVFKGKNKLTPEELEHYRKENKCFKCGEKGHSYCSFPQRNTRNEQPRASMVEARKEDVHCKGSPLSYAWGKVREHDAFILFDLGSSHNFISLELAAKVGVQYFEMGDAMKADRVFIGQDVSVTPLIGKLRLHNQGYVDKEDFFISPLKHKDVILGAPWFDHLAASIKFPKRKISFKFKEKDMYINAQESGSTIPLVNDQAFDKSIKSSIFAYMIFVKDSLNGVNETQVNESRMQEDLEMSNFSNQFQARWRAPKVRCPLQTIFCQTKKDYNNHYGLDTEGKDARLLKDSDVLEGDWLSVFSHSRDTSSYRVKCSSIRPEQYEDLLIFYMKVYQKHPTNMEVNVSFARAYVLQFSPRAVKAGRSVQFAWAIVGEEHNNDLKKSGHFHLRWKVINGAGDSIVRTVNVKEPNIELTPPPPIAPLASHSLLTVAKDEHATCLKKLEAGKVQQLSDEKFGKALSLLVDEQISATKLKLASVAEDDPVTRIQLAS